MVFQVVLVLVCKHVMFVVRFVYVFHRLFTQLSKVIQMFKKRLAADSNVVSGYSDLCKCFFNSSNRNWGHAERQQDVLQPTQR